jgi:hypothetical protein
MGTVHGEGGMVTKLDRETRKMGRTGRIQGINVDTQIYRFARTDSIFNFLDDPRRANRVNRAGLDDFKAAVAVVFVITGTGQGGPDSCMDVGIVGEQAFHVGVIKVRPMVNRCLRGGRPAKYFGAPCVSVDGY